MAMDLTEALAVALAAMDDRASWLEEFDEEGDATEADALTAAYLTLKALRDRLAGPMTTPTPNPRRGVTMSKHELVGREVVVSWYGSPVTVGELLAVHQTEDGPVYEISDDPDYVDGYPATMGYEIDPSETTQLEMLAELGEYDQTGEDAS